MAQEHPLFISCPDMNICSFIDISYYMWYIVYFQIIIIQIQILDLFILFSWIRLANFWECSGGIIKIIKARKRESMNQDQQDSTIVLEKGHGCLSNDSQLTRLRSEASPLGTKSRAEGCKGWWKEGCVGKRGGLSLPNLEVSGSKTDIPIARIIRIHKSSGC